MHQQKGQRALILALAGGCIPAFLMGCGENSATTSSTTSPTVDYSGASASTASDVTASVGSLTMTQSTASAGAMIALAQRTKAQRDAIGGGKGCGTVVVNSSTGGQVTDETITYALPACEFTGVFGTDSLAITGTLELTMPDTTGLDFTSKPTALEYAFTDAGVVSSETRSGTRSISATASSASQTNAMMTQFVKVGVATGTLVNDLTFSFTPASGSTLAHGQPLPDGSFQVNGTVSWTPAATGTTSATADSFTVSTTAPLVYDSSCLGTSASAFDSGQLRLVIVDGSVKTYGQITWTNCGAAVITVI